METTLQEDDVIEAWRDVKTALTEGIRTPLRQRRSHNAVQLAWFNQRRSSHAFLYHAFLYHALLYHALLYHALLYHALLYHALLYSAVAALTYCALLVATTRLSTHIDWSTGDPSPMYGAMMN